MFSLGFLAHSPSSFELQANLEEMEIVLVHFVRICANLGNLWLNQPYRVPQALHQGVMSDYGCRSAFPWSPVVFRSYCGLDFAHQRIAGLGYREGKSDTGDFKSATAIVHTLDWAGFVDFWSTSPATSAALLYAS